MESTAPKQLSGSLLSRELGDAERITAATACQHYFQGLQNARQNEVSNKKWGQRP